MKDEVIFTDAEISIAQKEHYEDLDDGGDAEKRNERLFLLPATTAINRKV